MLSAAAATVMLAGDDYNGSSGYTINILVTIPAFKAEEGLYLFYLS